MIFLFFLLWIVLNGRLTWEVFLTGLVLVVPVYLFFCIALRYRPSEEWEMVRHFSWFLRYFVTLIKEIVKANAAVIGLILSDKLEPEPRLVHFRMSMKKNSHEVLLANSITLTPGTITVDLTDDDMFVVHALDKEFAEDIENSVFVKMIKELEEGK